MNQNPKNQVFRSYLAALRSCLKEIKPRDIDLVAEYIYVAYLQGKHVYIFGNGGSASTACHFARDLSIGIGINGKSRVKALSLADNIVTVTSLANDLGYENVFKEQLVGSLEEGDVAIGISCSGNSLNILAAIEYANNIQAKTVGFSGFGGGKLKEIVDLSVNLSSHDYGPVEDMHLALAHIVSYLVRERIRG